MAFDWKEFLNLARFLEGDTSCQYEEEAAWRSAVSRAYYAAYCYACHFARDRHGFSLTYTADDHQEVRRHFRRRGMVDIAAKLDRLRQWRNECDYRPDTPDRLPLIVRSAVSRAQEVLNRLA